MSIGRRVEEIGGSPAPVVGSVFDSRRDPLSARSVLEVLPAAVALALLLIALGNDGAFATRHWAPLGVTTLALLAFSPLRTLRGPPLVAVLAAWGFAAWTGLSAAWSETPGAAVEGACRALVYAGLFTVPVATLPDRRSALRIAALAAGALVVFVVVVTALVVVRGEELFLAGRLDDPVGYRNGTAALFVMAFWPLLCVAAARDMPPTARAAAFTAAQLALGLAFLTQSRGAAIGFLAGALVALLAGGDRLRRAWLAVAALGVLAAFSSPLLGPYDAFQDATPVGEAVDRAGTALLTMGAIAFVGTVLLAIADQGLRGSPGTRGRLRGAAAALLAGGALVGAIGAVAAVGNPVSYAGDKLDEFRSLDTPEPGATRLGSTGGQRYDLWRIAWDEFTGAPLAGGGEGSYETVYYRERTTDRNLSVPHSLPLRVLAELGLVGAALLAAFLAAVGVAVARAGRSGSHARWSVAAAAAGAVFVGQVTVDWLWLIPGVTGLALGALGLAVALAAHGGPPARTAGMRSWPRAAARGACCLAALAVAAFYLADYETREARAQGASSAAEQLDHARSAQRLNPLALPPHLLEAGALEDLGRRDEARAALHDALELEPGNFVVLALLGDLELRAGREERARQWYRRALERNPRDIGLRRLAAG